MTQDSTVLSKFNYFSRTNLNLRGLETSVIFHGPGGLFSIVMLQSLTCWRNTFIIKH